MTPNPAIMKSVEQLGYRVTVGDVAAQAGLEVNFAQQGLLTLASEAGGHLQVADSGDIIYLFPNNFRLILLSKFWRLRLQSWWEKIWKIIFYLIRISFGIILLVFLLIVAIAIMAIVIASMSSRDGEGDSGSSYGGGNGFIFFPSDIFWIFSPNYNAYDYESRKSRRSQQSQRPKNMNFLEAVFSFLFGDGNPNFDLEERRWREIGKVIRTNGGAVIGQQIAPYLDNINQWNQENEDYILPVLARFNGYPQVSPQGEIIYYFPELQVTAKKRRSQSLSSYLSEKAWRFSEADSGQILLAIGLGVVYLILTIVLGSLLSNAAMIGEWIIWLNSAYGVFLGYAIAFLTIPLVRYFWLQGKNSRIDSRNQRRQARAEILNQADELLKQKLTYARQFAAEKVIKDEDITYSTEKDLLEQEIERSDKIDQEWQRRLESGSSEE